ncbi:hypothetical protein D4764_18G0000930 [Takifugu flavidus]|uniref:Apoptosis regulator Bcl-2 family BH4 domain-containing protein n=1 Tax=Takifugu flavidus TaxID=433684 RepID=A0A5C6NUJ9_9TELE|nr:hypothetical protein D4764_18G0000930 [Takifugu flavidus]
MSNRELVENYLIYKLSQKNYPGTLLRPKDALSGLLVDRESSGTSPSTGTGREDVNAALWSMANKFEQDFTQPAISRREDTKGNRLAFLDCAVKITEDRNLTIEVYRKPTHTDQYLQFNSHHPLEHRLGVIRTLQHWAREILATSQGRKKEQDHIKAALKTCGDPDLAFTKTSRKRDPSKGEEERNKCRSVSIPYLSRVSEKFRRILQKHDIPVHFKPSNTLRQRLDSQVRILAREDRWFERGVKEAIHVKLEKPSLNRVGGLRHVLSPTYNAVLHSFQQQNKHSHHSRRPSDSPPCDPADKGETPQQKLGERPDKRPC